MTIAPVPAAIAFDNCELRLGGGLEIRGGTGGDVSGGLSKLIELLLGDGSNDCSVASSASSNRHRVPMGISRINFSFGVLITEPLRCGRTG